MKGPLAWRFALVGALALSALSVAPARATDQNVNIVDFAFNPGDITISLNDRVIWTNSSQSSHTVTSDARAFDSGQLVPRQQYVLTFQRPGEFPYFCRFHPQQMRGVVHVGGGGPSPTTVPGAPGATTTTRPGTPVPTTTLTTISNTTSSFLLPTTSSTSTSTTLAPFDTTPPQASSANTGGDNDDDTTRRVAAGIAGALIAAGVLALILVQRAQGV